MRIVLELESGKENYYINLTCYLISHTIEQQHLGMNERFRLYNSLYYKILPVC